MFVRRIVPSSLIAGIVFSVGTAFAHQPPVLTAAQHAAERAVACERASARPGDGYRNSFVRFGDSRQMSHERFAKARPGDGYRQSVVRFGPTSAALVACAAPAKAPLATASR